MRLACVALATVAIPAEARATFFYDSADAPVSQAAVRVFLRQSEGTVTMIVDTQAIGAPGELAWIVPVPSEPEVTQAAGDPFAALDAATAPVFRTRDAALSAYASSSSSGCGSSAESADPYASEDVTLVTPWNSPNVGSHTVEILTPASVDELRAILEDQGFNWRPEAAPAVERYVAQGWSFVVARSSPSAADPVLEPLVLRWIGDELSVPLALSATSATEDMDVLVWIVAAGRAVPRNWTQVGVDDEAVVVDSVWSNYPDLVAEGVDAAAQGRGFVTEYAQPVLVTTETIFEQYTLELVGTEGWLTRLHSRIDPEDLDDDPIFVVQDEPEPVDNYHDLTVLEGSPYYAGVAGWAGAALVPGALFWVFRRRR